MSVRSIGLFVGLLLCGFPVSTAPPGPATYDIGSRKQVFIDGRYLDSATHVRISVNQPVKTHEKCLVGNLRGYDTVLAVDGTFKGFHALSKDGVHWRRAKPGDSPEAGDILGLYDGQRVPFKDPLAKPEERYKLFSASEGIKFNETVMRASADGAAWREIHRDIFPKEAEYPRGMDSQNVCFYDTRLKKYVAYVRVNLAVPVPPKHQPYFDELSTVLNVDTSALGLLRVEIQDQAGQPIPGFTLEDCDRIHTANSTKKAVRWRGESSVAALAGQTIRLRFELQYGVKLYAFRFASQS